MRKVRNSKKLEIYLPYFNHYTFQSWQLQLFLMPNLSLTIFLYRFIDFLSILISCFRNYYVKRIPNSNLIFLAINNTIPKNMAHIFTTTPRAYTSEAKFKTGEPINSSLLLPCQKLELNNLSRRILTGCYNEHPLVRSHIYKNFNFLNFYSFQEHEIKDCGALATNLKVSVVIMCVPFLLFTLG